jgi:hypothetical protein
MTLVSFMICFAEELVANLNYRNDSMVALHANYIKGPHIPLSYRECWQLCGVASCRKPSENETA